MKDVTVHDWRRGSGKTREVTRRVLEEKNVLVICQNKTIRRYMIENYAKQYIPKKIPAEAHRKLVRFLEKSIATLDMVLAKDTMVNYDLRTHKYDLVLIDEGLSLDMEPTFNLIYLLGSIGVPVEVYGSTHIYTDQYERLVRDLTI